MTEQRSAPGSIEVQRPAIMEELTETQLFEIENQFDEGDREGYAWRAESFGWTPEQAAEVGAGFETGRHVKEAFAKEQ